MLTKRAQNERTSTMLRIYPFILETLTVLRPVILRIERCDRDLGRQARRCGSSIALGVAEGMYSRGRNRAARYHTALGSARETMSCIETAVALGYLPEADASVMDRLDRIVGTLVKLVERNS